LGERGRAGFLLIKVEKKTLFPEHTKCGEIK
jgi:hypothetical protein